MSHLARVRSSWRSNLTVHTEISSKAGVPDEFQGCHTMFVAGYVVDGHVPVKTIRVALFKLSGGFAALAGVLLSFLPLDALFAVNGAAFLVSAALLLPPVRDAALPAGEGLPGAFIAQFTVALLSALAAAWVLRALVERRPPGDLGFPLTRRATAELAGGLLAGAGAMALVVTILSIAGVFTWTRQDGGGWAALGTYGAALAAFAIPAAAEEAVFRGYLLDALREGSGALVAVTITSVLFAAAHGGNPGVAPLAFTNLLLAGVLLAVAVLRTGTLWLATGVHLGWNWVMAAPLDLPVSGLDPYDNPLYDAAPADPLWLSGGLFGPEGGLAGTFAALIALALIIRLTRPGAPLAPAAAHGRFQG